MKLQQTFIIGAVIVLLSTALCLLALFRQEQMAYQGFASTVFQRVDQKPSKWPANVPQGIPPVNPNNQHMAYYQTFPIEEFPGLKCYVFVTSSRFLVATSNCNPVVVFDDRILVDNIVIPRMVKRACNRCFMADYLSVMHLMLFGHPEHGVPPLAPKGVLLIEDDTIICKNALPLLHKCFAEQYNCRLGNGNGVNFFASPTTTQAHPELYGKMRYYSVEDLYTDEMASKKHIDWFFSRVKRPMRSERRAIHLLSKSTLRHRKWYIEKCPFNESLAWPVAGVTRYRDFTVDKPWKLLPKNVTLEEYLAQNAPKPKNSPSNK